MSDTNTQPAEGSTKRNRRAKIVDYNQPKEGTTPLRFGCHFDFLNGRTFFADATKLPGYHESIVGTVLGQLAISRLHNKMMDSYADPTEVPDAEHEARTVYGELVKGVWSQRGEGGPKYTDLARAVAELFGKTVDEAQSALDAQSKEQRKAISKDPAISAKVTEIQAKRAAEKLKEKQKAAKGHALPKLFG